MHLSQLLSFTSINLSIYSEREHLTRRWEMREIWISQAWVTPFRRTFSLSFLCMTQEKTNYFCYLMQSKVQWSFTSPFPLLYFSFSFCVLFLDFFRSRLFLLSFAKTWLCKLLDSLVLYSPPPLNFYSSSFRLYIHLFLFLSFFLLVSLWLCINSLICVSLFPLQCRLISTLYDEEKKRASRVPLDKSYASLTLTLASFAVFRLNYYRDRDKHSIVRSVKLYFKWIIYSLA